MFSRATDFARRHRKKLLVTSALAGGLVLLGKLAETKFRQWQEEETREYLERTRRRHHFESTERTGNVTLQSLLPALKKALVKRLDTEGIVAELRENSNGSKSHKVEKWNELKVSAFAGCVAYILGSVYLSILLRIQLHVLGGYLYQETTTKCDGNGNSVRRLKLSSRVQDRFLTLCHLFATDGVAKLCDRVRERIISSGSRIGDLPLNRKMTLLDLEAVFRDVMPGVLTDETLRPSEFVMVLEESSTSSLDQSEKSAFQKLTAEVMDILESSEVGKIVTECANLGLASVFDRLVVTFQVGGGAGGGDDDVEPSYPVAKIVPMLNKILQSDTGRGDSREGGWDPSTFFLCSSPSMKQFSANVYEAFCQSEQALAAAEGQHQEEHQEAGNDDYLSSVQTFIRRYVW